MRKNSKCINIFEENKKDLNLYQISIIVIVLITFVQIGVNIVKYTQLKSYISSHNSYQILQNKKVNDNQNNGNQNSYTQKYNINLAELEEVSLIIGMKKIERIYSDSNKIEIEGFCKNIKVLEKLAHLKNIEAFNIKSLEKQDRGYKFDIEYKIGGIN